MEDFIFTPIVLGVGLAIHTIVSRTHTRAEGRLLNLSFAAHIVSAFGQILLVKYYFGYGDLLTYHTVGAPLADALRLDFWGIAPELVTVIFHGESYRLPVELLGGESTSTMTALTAFLLFVVGNSIYAASVLVALTTYVAKVLIYRAVRPEFAPDRRQAILVATTLVPSAVFWSSAILKEAVVVAAVGPLVLALRWLLERRRTVATVAVLLASATLIALLKPYVLIALSGSAALHYVWVRMQARGAVVLKPMYVAFGLALGTAGFVGAATYFNRFSVDSVGSSTASLRRVGYEVEGGSNFYLEASDVGREAEDRTIAQEMVLAPFALATSLFRPFLFEARNAIQLVNALEMTALLVLAFQTIRRNGLRGIASRVLESPTLLFCAAFTLTLALGTGLASSNLGSLSRYRAPMMPFYVMLLLVLRSAPAAARRETAIDVSPDGTRAAPVAESSVR